MDPLQPDLPSPVMISKNWKLTVVDLTTIIILEIILESTGKYWKVLPQEMLNSPTLSQYYVSP